jgi:hypothetical protein
MRLKTILFMPTLTLRERARRLRDWTASEIAARIPQRIRYAALVQMGADGIGNSEIVPDVTFMDVLKRTPSGGYGA